MEQQTFTVTICQTIKATTPEHAAREIAYKLIRWDEEKYGPLELIVTDATGRSVTLTHDDYVPTYFWQTEGNGGIT